MKKKKRDQHSTVIRKAEFRFTVVGSLLSSPPEFGNLKKELEMLANKPWQDLVNQKVMRLTVPTIERWYYKARRERLSPIHALENKLRMDLGSSRAMPEELIQKWKVFYDQHPHWSLSLLYDNFKAFAEQQNPPLDISSYSTLRRLCLQRGWVRKRKPRCREDGTPLASSVAAEARRTGVEIRSFECEYVGGLWHLDFHKGSRSILLEDGTWVRPVILGILDDGSRLICHAQWYLEETTPSLVHGFSQAIQKRGRPRALMSDNGKAMKSEEFTSGLIRLSICHELTLEYSPYQNGKQEKFWAQIEGRLLPMLEDIQSLTLNVLNDLTQIWIEGEYNNKIHSEIKETPVHRFSHGKSVLQESPSSDELKKSFVKEIKRRQRKTDGTISLEGVRFEIPSAYRHHSELWIHYPSWDLSSVYLVDSRTRKVIQKLVPVDLHKNANGKRAFHAPVAPVRSPLKPNDFVDQLPPQMQKLVKERQQEHLPPAYLPQTEF
jgi:transposase InsO family protein